jgi:hypothetical protein
MRLSHRRITHAVSWLNLADLDNQMLPRNGFMIDGMADYHTSAEEVNDTIWRLRLTAIILDSTKEILLAGLQPYPLV